MRRIGTALLIGLELQAQPAGAKPVTGAIVTVAGVQADVVRIDLRDPATVATLVLAHRPLATPQAPGPLSGDEPFASMVQRAGAAAIVNGTYFRMDAARSVMGTVVAAGRLVNHVSFRPVGTTFALLAGNRPVMLPAGVARWRSHWLSLTAGPRLVRDGAIALAPRQEGFVDGDVLGRASRTALGYSRDGTTLYLVSIPAAIDLATEARAMRELGCFQAMNLDGGTSRALAENGRVRAEGRRLTNAFAVYDSRHAAPLPLMRAFRGFSAVGDRPLPLADGGPFVDPGPFLCGRTTAYHKLGAGRRWSFEGWRVEAATGRPLVRNRDGWLELSSGGSVSLSRPLAPVRSSHLNLLTQVEAQPLLLDLGAFRCSLSTRTGVNWLRDGRLLRHLSAAEAHIDREARHRLEVWKTATGWRAEWDHRALAEGSDVRALAARVTMSGAGGVKNLDWSNL